MQTSTWFKFKIGDTVWNVADPRHTGRIDRIHWSSRADITWHDTGWKSLGVPVADLRKQARGAIMTATGPERRAKCASHVNVVRSAPVLAFTGRPTKALRKLFTSKRCEARFR